MTAMRIKVPVLLSRSNGRSRILCGGASSSRRPLATSSGADQPDLRLSPTGTGGVATLTLCRPSKLNSLSMPMIHQLSSCYENLSAEGVRCLLLRGEGRAFCAGGDVAEVREGVLENNSRPADFFYDEYRLDYRIATLYEREKIMQVSLWDGIVMGGGVGLSVHSPIRLATEKTLFAMPETAIGLFPDVGATWSLSRLKAGPSVGRLLGLSGLRLGAADCLFAGLATHFCPSDRLTHLEERLMAVGQTHSGPLDFDTVSAVISEVANGAEPDTSKAVLESNLSVIDSCFSEDKDAVEEILGCLEQMDTEWASKIAKTLRKMSPTSLKISLEAIKRHKSISLREAFMAEYRMSQWCMRPAPHSDFCEGIRAVLIDKDNQPCWNPGRLEDVSSAKVAEFFAPLPSNHARGELRLP